MQYYSKISAEDDTRGDVALSADGQILGYVDADKNVIDEKGNLVGKQDAKGFIRDGKNEIIGRVINPDNVLDQEGNIIGKKDENGIVRDDNGVEIGKIDASGFMKNSSGEISGYSADSNNVYNRNGRIIGRLNELGSVVNGEGQKIGEKDANNNIVNEDGSVIGIIDDSNAVRDQDGKIIAHVQPDNQVSDFSGKIIGMKNAAGKIVDSLGQVIGKVFADGRVFDESGNYVGQIQGDGSVKDANQKTIGKLNADGTVVNANNNIIGGIGRGWYEKSTYFQKKKDSDVLPIGVVGDKQSSQGGKYRKSLNIALTPDGDYLGDILEDGSVVNKNGNVIGQKTPDGLIIDKDGTLIGIEEIKKPAGGDIFVPAGTFGQGSAYGIGNGPGDNLGPGGGYGPGERYNPQRSAALAVAQGQRRENMQVGKISSNIRKEAFDGMQKDWSEQGFEKSLSSWRVDMSEMILADKPIPAVLARSVDTANPTPVTAFVERNVYAEEGRNILIPAGSRLIGEFGNMGSSEEASSEAAKVQISWQRLIRPDGSMFKFDGITADAQGRGGALGYLDKQLFSRYSLPLLTTVLTSSTAYLMADDSENTGETENSKQEAANDARQNFLDQMNQVFSQILDDKSNIMPLSYVPAGTRIVVFPKADLWLRTVDRDKEAVNNEYTSKPKELINDSARLKQRDQGVAQGQVNNVPTSSDNGQVTYEEPQTESKPLIATDKYKKSNNTPQKQVIVPPPPPSSSGATSSYQSSKTNQNNTNTSSGNRSNETNNSVPQLF